MPPPDGPADLPPPPEGIDTAGLLIGAGELERGGEAMGAAGRGALTEGVGARGAGPADVGPRGADTVGTDERDVGTEKPPELPPGDPPPWVGLEDGEP